MSVKVCILSSEKNSKGWAAANWDYDSDPEIELEFHHISSKMLENSVHSTQLPQADYYIDCLPSTLSDQIRKKDLPLVGHSVNRLGRHGPLTEPQLRNIRSDTSERLSEDYGLEGQREGLSLDAFCRRRLEVVGDEYDRFSVLAFASSGSACVLAIAQTDTAVPTSLGDRLFDEDPRSRRFIEDAAQSIISHAHLAELYGCLRLDISIDNRANAITNLEVDLQPELFSQQPSSLDWMIRQVPGGHEFFLCLLLTQYQATAKGLTAKQATVCHAFDTISSQLASTFDAIAHVAVMRSLAFEFAWTGSILDVGCGQGVWGGLLSLYNDGFTLYGTDMSTAMISAPQIEKHYRSPIHVGPMEQTLVSSPQTDHITCFSVFQYCPGMTFMAAMSQMLLKARKSVTFDIPEVGDEYHAKLVNASELSKPHDHLAALERMGTPAGWKMVMFRHCLTYTEPNFCYDVYSRYVRFERVE